MGWYQFDNPSPLFPGHLSVSGQIFFFFFLKILLILYWPTFKEELALSPRVLWLDVELDMIRSKAPHTQTVRWGRSGHSNISACRIKLTPAFATKAARLESNLPGEIRGWNTESFFKCHLVFFFFFPETGFPFVKFYSGSVKFLFWRFKLSLSTVKHFSSFAEKVLVE